MTITYRNDDDLQKFMQDKLTNQKDEIARAVNDCMRWQADDIVRWVGENIESIGDVYSEKEIQEYVRFAMSPADVFSKDQLEDWAECNGYVKDE